MTTAAEPKRTSFMRYARVSEILNGDNALKRRLGKETVAVCRPDQTHVDFPVEVVHVTDEIHKTGIDAYTMPKIEVIRFAHRLLIVNPKPIVLDKPAAPPAPAPAARPKSRAVKAPRKAPPKKAPAKPKPKALPKAKAPAAPSPAAGEADKTGSAAKTVTVSAPPSFVRPFIPYVPGCAILSNFQAALTVLEPFVAAGDSDSKELCQKINDLIDDVHRRTVLPANAEKDVQSTG